MVARRTVDRGRTAPPGRGLRNRGRRRRDAARFACLRQRRAPGIVTPAWRPDGRAVDRRRRAARRTVQPVRDRARRREPGDAAADAHDRRRDLAGRLAGWADHRLRRLHGRRLRFVHHALSNHAVRARRSRSSSSPPAPVQLRRPRFPTLPRAGYNPLAHADADIVAAGHRNRRRPAACRALAIGGVDVLGYHAYSASATWLVDAPPMRRRPTRRPLDWKLAYAYDRWRADAVRVGLEGDVLRRGRRPRRGTRRDPGALARDRSRGARAVPARPGIAPGARVAHPHRRPVRADRRTGLAEPDRRPRWHGRRRPRRSSGYSISPERGITVGATGEAVLDALGSAADWFHGDRRRPRVPARRRPQSRRRPARRGGASSGDRAARRLFLLGGAAPANGVARLRRRRDQPAARLRANAFAGSRVALVNAEYRWPFARPAARRRHVAGVSAHRPRRGLRRRRPRLDGRFRAGDLKTSLGGELSARHRRRLLAAADGDGRRRVGTRRHSAPPTARPSTCASAGRSKAHGGLCYNCRA